MSETKTDARVIPQDPAPPPLSLLQTTKVKVINIIKGQGGMGWTILIEFNRIAGAEGEIELYNLPLLESSDQALKAQQDKLI